MCVRAAAVSGTFHVLHVALRATSVTLTLAEDIMHTYDASVHPRNYQGRGIIAVLQLWSDRPGSHGGG